MGLPSGLLSSVSPCPCNGRMRPPAGASHRRARNYVLCKYFASETYAPHYLLQEPLSKTTMYNSNTAKVRVPFPIPSAKVDVSQPNRCFTVCFLCVPQNLRKQLKLWEDYVATWQEDERQRVKLVFKEQTGSLPAKSQPSQQLCNRRGVARS